MERLAELDRLMKVNGTFLDTVLLLIAIAMPALVYYQFVSTDYKRKKLSWKVFLAMFVAAVAAFFLAQSEL